MLDRDEKTWFLARNQVTETRRRFDVTSFGESMLRLSVPAGQRLEVASALDVCPAGTESNVLSLLARLDRRCGWISGLPANSPGRLIANQLRMAGVDLSAVSWRDEGRVGTYYVEFGGAPRGIQVTYDRTGSCAAQLTPEQIDWDYLLNTRLLHLTGITPALSKGCLVIAAEAVRRAGQTGVPVSFDVNYRQRLWDEATAAATLLALTPGVELLFCAQSDAERLFGCNGSPEAMLEQLADRSAARTIVMSSGEAGVVAWDRTRFYGEPAIEVDVVDRIGAGDALAAGVIHGWLDGDLSAGLRMGTVLAALALSQHGDMVVTNPVELRSLLTAPPQSVSR